MRVIQSLFFLFFCLTLSAQLPERCGSDTWLEQMQEEQPEYIQQIKKGFADFKKQDKKAKSRNSLVTIPVHVIIVHPTGQAIGTGVNFSEEHVQSQIDVLNQDFGMYNSDAGQTPAQFPNADTGIQFCLATVDPDGNATDGITRYAFDGDFDSSASSIRQATRWPRDTYANIWVAPNLPYLGLASVPSTSGLPSPNNDFMHVTSCSFGGPGYGSCAPYALGRTTTHEMGHYLGLFHIWGGNGCGNDDGIDDTPVQDDSNFGCPNHPSPSCSNNGDMFMNYMDYVNDACMYAFTQEQGDYMNTILTTSRASLQSASAFACAFQVPLTLTVSTLQNPSCSGLADGFIVVDASGGSEPYSYSINGSAPSANNVFTDLPAGTYVIEVFDNAGATMINTEVLTEPDPIFASVVTIQTNNCPNDMNGSVDIQASGGTGSLVYTLNSSPTQSSSVFNNLENGFYAYSVIDINGCTYSDIFELQGAGGFAVTIDSTGDLTCSNDNTGFIMASHMGGSGPVQFSVDGVTFQDSSIFTSLDGGDYTVYALDSTGCLATDSVSLGEPEPFFLSFTVTDISCFGANDGALDVDAMGGNGSPYTYSFDSITFGDETLLDSLSPGEYTLYALDSLDCLALAFFDLEEPGELVLSVDSLVNVNCAGDTDGYLAVSATGGNGDFTYTLGESSDTTGIFTDLGAGDYTVYVEDVNGCNDSMMVSINTNSTITLDVEIGGVSCFGGVDGSIAVDAQNTVGDVMYTINGGTPQSEPTFSDLEAGEYSIGVVDDTNCENVVFVTVDEPAEMLVSVGGVIDVSCSGLSDGSAEIIVTGGTAPYEYEVSSGGLPEGLPAGTYNLIVTDTNGCIAEAGFTVNEPEAIEMQVTDSSSADCDTGLGGGLVIESAGGAGGFSYVFVGADGNEITSMDGKFMDLPFGAYTVVATDANGCTSTMEGVITYENDFYANVAGIVNLDCFGVPGGEVDIEVSGGMGEVTYALDGMAGTDPKNLNTTAGPHTITVMDENGCTIALGFFLLAPEELLFGDFTADTDLTINPEGGTEPYSYSFDGGTTFQDENSIEIMESMYDVVVRDANSCVVSMTITITSVDDIESLTAVNAFPNPFSDELTVSLEFSQNTDVSIEIMDIEGRLVHKIPTATYQARENFVKINLSNFASSIYIVKIASARGHRYIKATKM